jgi:hypothetical protein
MSSGRVISSCSTSGIHHVNSSYKPGTFLLDTLYSHFRLQVATYIIILFIYKYNIIKNNHHHFLSRLSTKQKKDVHVMLEYILNNIVILLLKCYSRFGYPDPEYLDRVEEQLTKAGITDELILCFFR